jgi:hypothetical protein
MDALITNMKANVHNATIRKLYNDGMITDLDTTTLNSNVRGTLGESGFGDMTEKLDAKGIPYSTDDKIVLMGELTVEQMMNYLNVIFTTLTDMGI